MRLLFENLCLSIFDLSACVEMVNLYIPCLPVKRNVIEDDKFVGLSTLFNNLAIVDHIVQRCNDTAFDDNAELLVLQDINISRLLHDGNRRLFFLCFKRAEIEQLAIATSNTNFSL